MIVQLTEEKVELAKRIADIRDYKEDFVPNRERHIDSRAISSWHINYVGALGEVATSILLDYPVAINYSLHGDSGAPDLYYKNRSIEVKTATYDPPILKFRNLEAFQSDVAILCFVNVKEDPSSVMVAGAVSRKKFNLKYKMLTFNGKTAFCMDYRDMTPILEFIELAKDEELAV